MNAFGIEGHTDVSKSGSKGLKLVARQAKIARKDMAATAKYEGGGGLRRKVANTGFKRNNAGMDAYSRRTFGKPLRDA